MPSQRYRYQKKHFAMFDFFVKTKLVLTVWVSMSLSKFCYSEVLLQKAGFKCLNEAVASITAVTAWKTKTFMDPLGQRIFWEKSSLQCTRSATSKDIGYPL